MVSRYLIWPLVLFHSMALAQKPLTSPPRPTPNIVEAEDFIGKHWQIDVSDITTDSVGYTYFATGNGVQRFDGYQLRPLHPDSIASQFKFHRFVKGAHNKLWLLSAKAIAYIEADSIKSYSLPDGMSGGEIETFYPDKFGMLHLGLRQGGYFIVDQKTGQAQKLFENNTILHGYCITQLKDGTPFFFSTRDSSSPGRKINVYYVEENVPKLVTQTSEEQFSPFASLSSYEEDELLFSTGGQEIIKLVRDSLLFKQPFKHKVRNLFVDSHNDIWIGTLDHGFFKALNGKLTEFQQDWDFEEAAVVAEDAHGGLWIKSDDRSFGYIPHPEILSYSSNNGMPHFENIFEIIQTKREIVYFGTPRGMYVLSDTIKYTPIPMVDHREGTRSYDLYPISMLSDTITNRIWLGFSGKIMSYDNEHWQTYELDTYLFENTEVWRLKVLPDGTLMGATPDGIFILKEGNATPVSGIGQQRILDFDIDEEGQVWVGTDNGLFLLENGDFKRPDFLKEGELVERCYMVKHDRGTIWVHPLWGELHRIRDNKLEKIVDNLGNHIKLRGYTITSKGCFWGVALKNDRFDLCQIETNTNTPKVTYYEFDNITKGMPVRGAFLATDSCIHWSSPSGAFTVKISELRERPSTVKAKIRELRVNHQVVNLKRDYVLKYNENYLNLAFDGISYSRSPIVFQYKMKGIDTSWLSTQYPQVQYTNLPAGDYEFQVQSRRANSNGNWSNMDSIHLTVAMPFWETLLFKIAGSLVLILVGAALVYFRSRYLVKKERANSKVALKMLRLELRALKAQINPHFIFNAISSAIYFITDNQKERARKYLVRFSKLIRLALENSEKNVVSLSEEIELIEKYIAIESERFENNAIEFDVVLEGSDIEQIKIPPALFQPYIENAIWHGLKNKKGARKIKLHCSCENGQLKIIIEDNGIGREASASLETESKHQSFGMMIASRRIELLNQKNVQNTVIDDLKDEGNRPVGTRVSIWLPAAV